MHLVLRTERDYERHLITVIIRHAVKCVHHVSCTSVCLPCSCELNTHLSIPHPSCCIAKQVTMLVLYHGYIALQQIYDKSVYLRITGYALSYHFTYIHIKIHFHSSRIPQGRCITYLIEFCRYENRKVKLTQTYTDTEATTSMNIYRHTDTRRGKSKFVSRGWWGKTS